MAASFGSGKFDLPEGEWVHIIVDSKETTGPGFLSDADKKAGKVADQKEQFEWSCQWYDTATEEWKERKIWTGTRFLPIGSIKSQQFTPAVHRLCTATKFPIPQSLADAKAFNIGEVLFNRYFVVKMMANPENPEELKEYWVPYSEQAPAEGYVEAGKAPAPKPAVAPQATTAEAPKAPKAAPAEPKAPKAPAAPPVPPAAAAAVTANADEYE